MDKPTPTALDTLAKHRDSHTALACSDAYSAQEAPRLREAHENVTELLRLAKRLEVAANTVARCYTHRPENFAAALRDMAEDAAAIRLLYARVGS